MNDTTVSTKAMRTLTGRVVSNKMDKTVIVQVDRVVTHPVYGKILRRRSRIQAHDESNACKEGDVVVIKQCRPLSRHKSWTLVQIVGHSDIETAVEAEAVSGAQS